MTEKLVSFLIPAFNSENTIRQVISSIVQQWPISLCEIIVRDGSTNDKTKDVVDSFGLPNLMYISNPQQPSVGFARKELIQLASGKYSCFVDSDDSLADGHFKILCPILTAGATDLVWFNYETKVFGAESKAVHNHFANMAFATKGESFLCSALFEGDDCNALWDKCIKTALLKSIVSTIDPSFSFGEDRMILLRVLLRNSLGNVVYLEHPLYCYSINPCGLNHSFRASYLSCLRENWCLTKHLYYTRFSNVCPPPDRYIVRSFVGYKLSRKYVPKTEKKFFDRAASELGRSELFLEALQTVKEQDRGLFFRGWIAANLPYGLARLCLRLFAEKK